MDFSKLTGEKKKVLTKPHYWVEIIGPYSWRGSKNWECKTCGSECGPFTHSSSPSNLDLFNAKIYNDCDLAKYMVDKSGLKKGQYQ